MNKVALITVILIIIIFLNFNNTLSTGFNIKQTMNISNLNENIPKEAWNKTFGGTALDWGWCVQETTDNGFIIAGETVSFGSGGYDAWLIKTDSNGNETWNKTFGGAVKDGGRTVQQTSDSGFIIGGYADSYGNPGHDVWLIKTDDEGNEEWDSIFGGLASDAAFSIWQTSDQGYISIGYAVSYGAGNHDIWLIKTDLYGNEEWNKTYGNVEWDLGYSIQQTEDDGFIIIGTTKSYGSGGQDAWLIKTDMYGNEEWNKTYGGSNNDWGSSVVMADDGGYLLTGDTRSYGSGGYDIWLIKTDKYGNEQWRRIYGDSASDDTGYSLKKTSDGGFIITGTKTSFDTGLTDVWLIKTDIDGDMQWNLTLNGGVDDWSYSVDETTDGGYIITGLTNSFGSGDYDLWLIKVEIENYENQPPNSPNIDGSTSGKAGKEYDYTFVTTDPNGDQVYYYVEWGDETNSGWLGAYDGGEDIILTHKWDQKGTYTIKAKAKDTYDVESEWATLSVSMPRNKEKEDPKPFGFILAFGTSVDVKPPGEDYIDIEILDKTFYIWDQEIITFNPGVFLRLYEAKGLFTPALPFCIGICSDYGIIG